MFAWLKRTFVNAPATQCVLPNYANALAVSGTATPVSVATGAAVVNGIPYESTTAVSVTVATPTLGPTGHRVVLRADYTANTVRVALLSASDGVATPPAVTQNASVWEVSLATLSITTGGVITVTDTRGYVHANLYATHRTRSFLVAAIGGEETVSGDAIPFRQLGVELEPTIAAAAFASFKCPVDYASALTITPVLIPMATGDIRMNHGYFYGSTGEAWNTHSVTSATTTNAVVTDVVFSPAVETLTGVAVGDIVVCAVARDGVHAADTNAGSVICTGFLVSYTADS